MANAGPWNDYAPSSGAAPAALPASPGASTAAASDGPWNDYAPSVSTGADVGTGFASGVERGLSAAPFAPGVAATGLGNLIAKASGGWIIPTDEQIAQKYKELQAQHPNEDVRPPPMASDLMGSAIGGIQSAGDWLAKKAGYGGDLSKYQPTTGYGEAAQDVGAFVPTIAANPLSAAGALGTAKEIGTRALTRAAAPGVGMYVGGEVAPAIGLDKETGQLGGAILGGATPAAVEAGIGLARPTIAPDVQEAANALKVRLPAGATSTDPVTGAVTQIMQKIPGANIPLNWAAGRALGDIDKAAGDIGQQIGASDPVTAGGKLKDQITHWSDGSYDPQGNWIDGTSRQMINDKLNAVSNLMPQGYREPLSETLAMAQKLDQEGIENHTGPSSAAKMVMDAVTDPNGSTFNGLRGLRSKLGSYLDKPSTLPYDIDTKDIARLYGALSQDAERMAYNGAGQQGLNAWNDYNTTAQGVINRRQNLAKVTGLDNQASPEQAFAKIGQLAGPKGDVGLLQNVKDAMLQQNGHADWNEIVGTTARQAGLDGGEFNSGKFFDWYNGLSDQGRDILFGPQGSPGFRQSYDYLATLGRQAKGYQVPHGATAQTVQSMGYAAEIGELLYNPAIAMKVGIPAGILGGLLARPATSSSFARWVRTAQAVSNAQRVGNATATMMRNLYGASSNLAKTARSAGYGLDPSRLMGIVGGRQ